MIPSRTASLVTLALVGLAAQPAFAQLSPYDPQFWHQGTAGVDLPSQGDAYFASALAAGDFDGNGFDDLAVGIPEYDLEEMFDVGMVMALYGGEAGLAAAGKDLWVQSHALLWDEGEENDAFGRTLATGDFDADGFDDLAIGVPTEGIGDVASAGAVQVLYGSASGLSTTDQLFWQGNLIGDVAEELDRFGSSLAVGDFDADGYDDLAIGVPYEKMGTVANAGAVHVLFGGAGGLTTAGDRFFAIGGNLPGSPSAADFLGWSLAAGDFDPATPGDELAVGAPGSTVTGTLSAGAVWMISNVEADSFAYSFDLDSVAMPGDAEFGDAFGSALAAGQFDGVGRVDLAITASRRPVDGVDDAGAVFVDYGDVRPVGVLEQSAIPGEDVGDGDFFGSVLTAGDFDADGVDDLAIGVEFETVAGDPFAGTVHVIEGVAGAGLSAPAAETLEQVMSPSEANDHFGAALVAGRFFGHTGESLAVGASLETFAGDVGAGAFHVYSSDALFVDSFESGDTSLWSGAAGGGGV